MNNSSLHSEFGLGFMFEIIKINTHQINMTHCAVAETARQLIEWTRAVRQYESFYV